jgi:hypothetical protein
MFRPIAILVATILAIGVQAVDTKYIVVNLHAADINDATFARIAALDLRNTKIRVGAAAIFSYLNEPHERLRKRLQRFLQLAEKHDVPVVVQPDGEQWWGNRPDLWNWWDKNKAGYDPTNRQNVEWTGWSPDDAIKIAWRNWGSQIRVLPPPNLMSPIYREACNAEMRRVVPVVMDWWLALPDGRKDLLIAIKVGWESSIGANAYYYPNGNRLLDRPAADDPKYGLNHEQLPGRGVIATGYAAASTIGLASAGELKESHQVEIVRRHLAELCRISSELGVPRDRLFTHVGGWKEGELLSDAALNPYASPGWSFYRHARNPEEDAGVTRARKANDAPYWGAVEWYPQGVSTADNWRDAMEATLSVEGCRYLCIYNWRSIADNENALTAIESLTRK